MRSATDRKVSRRPTWATWALAALMLASAGPVVAVDWDGSDSANWSDPNNWTPAALPTTGDSVVFPTPVPGTGSSITLSAGAQANNLTFHDSYTLTGGDLTLGATESVTVDAGQTVRIESQLKDAGAGYLKKYGTGTLVLAGDNTTYTRWMDVNGGVVRVVNGNAVPGGYFHVTNAASVVELDGGITVPAGKTIYLTGVATNDDPSFRSTSGDNVWGGNLVLHGGDGDHNVGVDAGSTLTINGTVSQSGGPDNLVKVGGGMLVMQGNGTYTGTTEVKQGTLRVNGTLGSTATVTVYDGAWLGGNGSIGGSVDVLPGAGISAGNSPGHLTVLGNYSQTTAADPQSTMLAELGGTDQGVNYDWIDVGGAAQVAGIVDIQLVDGFQPAYSDTFNVLTAAGGVEDLGIQLDWDPAQLAPAQFWTYGIVPFGSGEALQLQLGVPEPSALLLALLGLLALAPLARRRQPK